MDTEVTEKVEFPSWLKRRLPANYQDLKVLSKKLEKAGLHSVCQSAHCPNQGECFSKGTATFLLMGNICTRRCTFCAIKKGKPSSLDENEPERLANTCKDMNLKHVVLTCVTRDDLKDGGAMHFVNCVRSIKNKIPGVTVEILCSDMKGKRESLEKLLSYPPEILNHNIETVPSLYRKVRKGAIYERSLELITRTRDIDPNVFTKSGLMVGCGETDDEIFMVMQEMVNAGCQIFTIGQYLAPRNSPLPVSRYVSPEKFLEYKEIGHEMGFLSVHAGAYVRSSYLAGDILQKILDRRVDQQ
ncbi:MAG: lipoyl synthase [Planctomycetota bacterium]|nr:MAG: lipoyl synthase [Planctomycetota bacterium]